MSRKRLLPLLLCLLVIGLGYTLKQKATAPEVKFTTLTGQTMQLSQLRGKMVLVNFWATTCPGCIAEMPKLIETYKQRHPQGFEVIAVAMPYDAPDQIANYATKHALPFTVTHDARGELVHAFGDVKLTPTAILIDKQGHIVSTVVGELDFSALNQQLEHELGGAG
jgi:peroxiredoxin